MKKIALVHTVPSVYADFPGMIREFVGEVAICNTVDDFLASDPAEKGEFTVDNLNRLYFLLRAAELTSPDLIVTTCSTLTPSVEKLRPLIATPLLPIDGEVLKRAVAAGRRIALFATARSAVAPTREGLEREAALVGMKPEIEITVVDDAFTAIKRMDRETHDRLVKEAAAGIKDKDVVVLAQASMAHLENAVREISGIPTLSSPNLCLQAIKRMLGA